ncbi:MAG: fluoride efflux transporter FluC [Armatimonadota bacterium]
MPTEIALVLTGGGVGAVCRYLLALGAVRLWGEAFPWGTLLANLVGSFAVGVVYSFGVELGGLGPRVRLFLMTGLLGGMTTFSSFTLETSTLYAQTGELSALANLAANIGGGLVLLVLGMLVGRLL